MVKNSCRSRAHKEVREKFKEENGLLQRSIDYDEIWYFVSSRVVYDAVEKAAKEMDYVKIFI